MMFDLNLEYFFSLPSPILFFICFNNKLPFSRDKILKAVNINTKRSQSIKLYRQNPIKDILVSCRNAYVLSSHSIPTNYYLFLDILSYFFDTPQDYIITCLHQNKVFFYNYCNFFQFLIGYIFGNLTNSYSYSNSITLLKKKIIYSLAYSGKSAHPFLRNGALFHLKLSGAQLVD